MFKLALILLLTTRELSARTNCPMYCRSVGCEPNVPSEEKCLALGRTYVPMDPAICQCCSQCIIRPNCSPDCRLVKCIGETPEGCAAKGLPFVEADPTKCICCSQCGEPLNKPYDEEKRCRAKCEVVGCAWQDPKECSSKGLTYIPSDTAKCRCCPQCRGPIRENHGRPKTEIQKRSTYNKRGRCPRVTQEMCLDLGLPYLPTDWRKDRPCPSCGHPVKICRPCVFACNDVSEESCNERGLEFIPDDNTYPKCKCCASCSTV